VCREGDLSWPVEEMRMWHLLRGEQKIEYENTSLPQGWLLRLCRDTGAEIESLK